VAQGLCRACYGRRWAAGTLPDPTASRHACSVCGKAHDGRDRPGPCSVCLRPHYARGLCHACYERWRRAKAAENAAQAGRCAGCGRLAALKQGLCGRCRPARRGVPPSPAHIAVAALSGLPPRRLAAALGREPAALARLLRDYARQLEAA
jgi:hypothetical protein